jgi:phosphonate transport system ATP-binding protein
VSDRVVAVREGSFVLDAPTADTTEEQIRAVYAQAERD